MHPCISLRPHFRRQEVRPARVVPLGRGGSECKHLIGLDVAQTHRTNGQCPHARLKREGCKHADKLGPTHPALSSARTKCAGLSLWSDLPALPRDSNREVESSTSLEGSWYVPAAEGALAAVAIDVGRAVEARRRARPIDVPLPVRPRGRGEVQRSDLRHARSSTGLNWLLDYVSGMHTSLALPSAWSGKSLRCALPLPVVGGLRV